MTTLHDRGTHAEEQLLRAEVAPSIRPLAEQDHHAIHEILISRTVIDGTMRLPHAAARETAQRLAPRSGRVHLVADIDGCPVGVLELVTWPDEPRHRRVGYGFRRGKYIDARVMARLNPAKPSAGLG